MDGGAQFKYLFLGSSYGGFTIDFYSTGTLTGKNVWVDETKSSAMQQITADANGMAVWYADGDYRMRISNSDGILLWDWPSVKITSDTATMWEGNFGLSYPSATATNRWHQFAKHDANNNFLELGINEGAAFRKIIDADTLTLAGNVINVRESTYGALGDDGTNDTSAFNTAVAAARTNNLPLYIPAGTYLVNLVIDGTTNNFTDFVMMGDGFNSILKAYDATKAVLEIKGDGAIDNYKTVLKDFSINGNGNTTTYAMILSYMQNPIVNHVRVTNAEDLLYVGPYVYDGHIEKCFIQDPVANVTATSVYLYGNTNHTTIEDCVITGGAAAGGHGNGIYVNRAAASGNNLSNKILNNTITGFVTGINVNRTKHLVIENNHLEENTANILVQPDEDNVPNPWGFATQIRGNYLIGTSPHIYINYGAGPTNWWAFDGFNIEGNYFYIGAATSYGIKFNASTANRQIVLRIGKNYHNHNSGDTFRLVDPASTGSYIYEMDTRYTSKSATWDVLERECNNSTYTNGGAVGTITANLPVARIGMEFTFVKTANHVFRINPQDTEYIRGGGAGKYLVLETVGATVRLKCLETGYWEIMGSNEIIAEAADVSYIALDAGDDSVDRSGFNSQLVTLRAEINAIKVVLNKLIPELEL